jgi:hypothetical protein
MLTAPFRILIYKSNHDQLKKMSIIDQVNKELQGRFFVKQIRIPPAGGITEVLTDD